VLELLQWAVGGLAAYFLLSLRWPFQRERPHLTFALTLGIAAAYIAPRFAGYVTLGDDFAPIARVLAFVAGYAIGHAWRMLRGRPFFAFDRPPSAVSVTLWRVFKFCFSALLIALSALCVAVYLEKAEAPVFIGLAGFLLFCAAAPWVDYTKPSIGLGLVCIVVAMGIAYFALEIWTGAYALPRECTGRRRTFCELHNFLYRTGGPEAAAAPWLAFFAAAIYGAFAAFKRALRAQRNPA
jgi:hypothetical protein